MVCCSKKNSIREASLRAHFSKLDPICFRNLSGHGHLDKIRRMGGEGIIKQRVIKAIKRNRIGSVLLPEYQGGGGRET